MDASKPTIDERKLTLEEKRLDSEFSLKKAELDLKAKENGWFNRLFSPLTTTLFAGILTLAASALGAYITGANTLGLEREKFKSSKELETQKQQHELLLKMISVTDPELGKRNIQFLAESGLIGDDLANKIRIAAAKNSPLIPPSSGLPQRSAPCDNFIGATRRAAKLSIATGSPEIFKDLHALAASLPSEATLLPRIPSITSDPTSERVPEEQRNVRFRGALYAARREVSNDYHLIIGPNNAADPKIYLIAIISGLPDKTNPSFQGIQSACESLVKYFEGNLPGRSYDFYDPPIPVEIEGSLLVNEVPLRGLKRGPSRQWSELIQLWDVRPITKLTFLQ